MPSRLFDQLDIINVSQGYTIGPSIANCSPALTNPSFSVFSITGSGSSANPAGAGCGYTATYTKTGTLDVTRFPAIPINAIITKISYKCPSSVTASANASASPISIQTCHIFCTASFNLGSRGVGAFIFDELTQSGSISLSKSNAAGGSFIDIIGPYTYAELISLFTSITLTLQLEVTASAQPRIDAAASIDFNASISNFQVEIFYTTGPFSWYLKTHTSTIGGKSSIVVDDIVAIDDGTSPPVDGFTYIFYGTDDNFPTRADIPLYYWYDPISFTILYQPVRPAIGWLLQLVNFTADLQFDMALESIIVLMTDPSGIYTLVEGQRHDTLYERFLGVPSINVKIPDPFAKTGFVP